jgi:plastocyanin
MRSLVRGLATVALGGALAACSGTGTPATAPATTAAATSAPAATAQATSAPAAATQAAAPCMDSTGATTVDAIVENYQWSQPISAKVGDVITWTNKDSEAHQVRLADGSCAMKTRIAPDGGTQSLVFTTPGSYRFYCVQHVTMKGVITIQ